MPDFGFRVAGQTDENELWIEQWYCLFPFHGPLEKELYALGRPVLIPIFPVDWIEQINAKAYPQTKTHSKKRNGEPNNQQDFGSFIERNPE